MGLLTRIQHGWDAFLGRDPTPARMGYYPVSYAHRPDRVTFSRGNERSIVTAVYNRIAMDAAAINVKHVVTDKQGNFKEEKDSGLNNCLKVCSNILSPNEGLLTQFQEFIIDLYQWCVISA